MNTLGFLHDYFARISAGSPEALLLMKVTLLLAVAWIIHFGLARANPRWRTLLWHGTAVGLTLLAVWTLGLPSLEVRVHKPEPVAATSVTSVQPTVAARALGIPPVALEQTAPVAEDAEMAEPVRPTTMEISRKMAPPLDSPNPPWSWSIVFAVIWGFGAALLAIRMAAAYIKVAGLLGGSEAAPAEIIAEAQRIAAVLQCRRPVQVRISHRYAVPFLAGLRRPVLVLPERMCRPEYRGQLPGILAHELTHVRSGDFGWNAVLQAVSAVLWFHPLAWGMRCVHRTACDAICDAVSAAYLGDVQGYCRTLARVALEGAASFPATGLAMARTCDVRRRIAVLQQRVFSASLGRGVVIGVALAGLISMSLLAGLRLALAEPPLQASKGQKLPPAASSKETAIQPIRGKVIDETGRPVADADVWLSVYCDPPHGEARVQHVKSNSQGRFTVEVPPAWVARMIPNSSTSLWACAAGRQLGTKSGQHFNFEGDASDQVIRLKPAAETSFIVVDPEGKPLAGALLQPYYVTYEPTPPEILRRIEARTDADGRVKIPSLGRNASNVEIRVITKLFGIQVQRYTRFPLPAENTIRLRPVGRVKGRIIADKPEWVRGVRIILNTEKLDAPAPPWLTEGCADVESDAEGRFEVPAIAAGRIFYRGVLMNEKLPVRPKLPEDDLSGERPEFVHVDAERTTLLRFPMIRVVDVLGTVRAKDTHEPIPGLKIIIQYGTGCQNADAISDAEGRFKAQVLPGPIRIYAMDRSEKFIQWGSGESFEVPQQAGEFNLLPLELERAKTITGRLVDEQDQPIADAMVNILVENRRYGLGKSSKSDVNGQFKLTGVPATIDAAKTTYEVHMPASRQPLGIKPEIIRTNPLVLRVKQGTHTGDGS
jgi:beta-lactamase regulating signal transducer with metallopeptidase domain